MTPKDQVTVTSSSEDPLAQLSDELATFRDEQIERQLRKGEQINLNLNLNLPDADAPDHTEPTSASTHSNSATWTCRSCFHKEAARQLLDGYGPRVCDRCGERLNSQEVHQVSGQQFTPKPSRPARSARQRNIKVFDHAQLLEATAQLQRPPA